MQVDPARLPPHMKGMRRNRLILGILIGAIAVIAIVAVLRFNDNSIPADETAFINGMKPIMAQVNNPAGVQDLDGLRHQRAAMICQTIGNLQISNWTGTVDKVDTSIGGAAILSIAVLPDVDFGTAPNALSNMSSNTLIASGTPLFQTVSGLQVGQKVQFTGQLFSSQDDCAEEASVTANGSMQQPLFITRFTSITPLAQPGA